MIQKLGTNDRNTTLHNIEKNRDNKISIISRNFLESIDSILLSSSLLDTGWTIYNMTFENLK